MEAIYIFDCLGDMCTPNIWCNLIFIELCLNKNLPTGYSLFKNIKPGVGGKDACQKVWFLFPGIDCQ